MSEKISPKKTPKKLKNILTDDLRDLAPHLVPLRRLQLRDLGHRVHAHARAVDLDLVRVHRRVRDEDLGVFDPPWLADADRLVEDKPLVQERVGERAPGLLEHVDGVEGRRAHTVLGPLEAEHRVDGELREVVAVVRQDLGRERRARDAQERGAEGGGGLLGVVDGPRGEGALGDGGGGAEAGDDGHGVDLGGDLKVFEIFLSFFFEFFFFEFFF